MSNSYGYYWGTLEKGQTPELYDMHLKPARPIPVAGLICEALFYHADPCPGSPGCNCPGTHEGYCQLTSRDGWTILAYWDNSLGGRVSAFIFWGKLSFEEMIERIEKTFPTILARARQCLFLEEEYVKPNSGSEQPRMRAVFGRVPAAAGEKHSPGSNGHGFQALPGLEPDARSDQL